MRTIAAFLALLPLIASAAPVREVALGRRAMVATEQHYATQAGVDVLRAGGNAVDAAVAVVYALAVVDPCCGNIGGGGFMLVRMHDGRERFIDFREKAPGKATRDMYLDANGNAVPERSKKGWLAVGVPGTVLGMETARKEFGTMSRAALMAPAIALARNGYTFQSGDLLPFGGSAGEGYGGLYSFARQPNVHAIFMPKGRFPVPGEVLKQPQLARTLQLIDAGGAPAFYDGPIAQAVVAASRAGGGVLTMQDFRSYSVEEAAPLHCAYHGYDVASVPPPSSGGVTLCEILNIIAPLPLATWGWHSIKSLHYVTEAERRAYADRNAYLGDPDFVKDPVTQLLAPAYAAKLRGEIDPDRATPSVDVKPGLGAVAHENNETTHFSIVDAGGNAVAVTFTINDWFGAGVIAGDTGFFLNDEMDDFTAKPGVANMYGLVQGARNDVQPGKRPLSSMTPTIVTKDGKLAMVTGSPGGSRIPTIALETILNALVYGMNAQQAVDAPRTHMQWLPDRIEYNPGAFSAATRSALQSMGYALHEVDLWGSAQAVVVDPVTGLRYGGSDDRHPAGEALGY
jgi:gamma-glutamyltranspeptidase / glutathione hydrolase